MAGAGEEPAAQSADSFLASAFRLGDPSEAELEPRHFLRLRAEQVHALYANVAIGVLGAAIAAAILTAMLIKLEAVEQSAAILWSSYIITCAGLHLGLRHAYFSKPVEDERWQMWGRWFTLISLAEGLGWGWGSLFLVNGDHFDLEMLIIVVSVTIAGAAIPVFGSYLPAFFAIFVPTTSACIAWGVLAGPKLPQATAMLWMTLLYAVAMSVLGIRANANFKELVGLRIRTAELASDLRKQKELAEQANIAKSSFLAAASHDLRQPVHALGLFAGALRGVGVPPEALHMVGQIEASAAAMDSLFTALLDISKLDAGVVEQEPRSFLIQHMLERILRDHVGEANDKGLRISLVPCAATVFTDPVLLERVLRNLVSNAVRYTRKGRILIGCRRQGRAVRVQVLDTGPGISEAHRDRIFEEYFQIENSERDRAKGLGLGLAIVRRLTNLLACPLELRSVAGRGSCFSVTVRVSRSPATYAEPDAIQFARPVDRGLIIVVDDEAAIREAMSSLLKSWGYTVVAAGSGAEILAKLATCSMRPELIICDYRLRYGENGIAVIEQLQSEYNVAIPAMLVTGDTAEDRLIEAQASGFLLLHKPVANRKLRAAITNLIASSKENHPA